MSYLKYRDYWNIIIFQFIFFLNLTAQNQNPFENKNIFITYSAYTSLPREVVYSHLNKSTYIKGESIGFTNYIIDKKSNEPSNRTTNVYCTISDITGNVIKSKLVKAERGISYGEFSIDSLFVSGIYTFKAYTNWMNNFEEQNYYIQKIQIIDPDDSNLISSEQLKIDAQILPEGGHLISEIKNTLGVIVKDSLGFGLPFVKGTVLDKNDSIITSFKTNRLGIGKFSLIPESDNFYKVNLSVFNKSKICKIASSKKKGINFSIEWLGLDIAMTIRTSQETYSEIKYKPYSLIIHNGSSSKIFPISFKEKSEINTLVKNKDLYTGINIITLLDNKNNPIVERIIFNYEGIKINKSQNIKIKKEGDSITLNIYYKHLKNDSFNSISVSILPSSTESYQHHHNIISYLLLQPYINSPIEDGKSYFTNIDQHKKQELDDLLLTQGWSSYDWSTIFNNPPKFIYNFENGITVQVNLNSKTKYPQFYFYELEQTDSFVTQLSESNNSFTVDGLYPFNNEKIMISNINNKGQFEIPKLYLQFVPSIIPELVYKSNTLGFKKNWFTELSKEGNADPFYKNFEKLDEVIISYNKNLTRIEKLKSMSFGQVDVFNDSKRKLYRDFFSYIRTKGFDAFRNWKSNENGDQPSFIIRSRMSTSLAKDEVALIYINDIPVISHDKLADFDMSIVDYVEVSKQGVGMGLRGSGGIIKIYTDPNMINRLKIKTNHLTYAPPLTFSKPLKKFYIPVYSSYHSNFFKEYGIIDWFPNSKTDDNGVVNLKILNTNSNKISLFIEGITNDGIYISEKQIININ